MAINKKNVKCILPLTHLQEGLLFHYLKDSKNTFYVEQIVLSINGDFNKDICKNAWQYVVDSNECLRTSFFWEKLSKPVQVVLLKNELDFKFHDFSDKNNDDQKNCFNNVIDKDRKQNFNIIHVPFRINLVKHNKSQYSLIVTNHHILYDGWSNGIILKEFISNYLSLSKDLPLVSSHKVPYSRSIKDFIDLSAKADGNFWKKYLENHEAQNEYLPQNNLIVKDHNHLFELKLRSNLVDKINTCCKSHNITKAAFFHACYGILLFKYNLRKDICFGSAISCRDQLLKGIENVVGLFMNTLPFRINIDKSNILKDYLIDIQDTLQNINDNKYVTLKRIKNTILKSDEDLFNSILAIDNYPVDLNYITKNQSFTIDSFENFETTNYDLSLNIVIHNDNIAVKFNYNNRFDSEFIRMISSHFEQLIEFVSENSDQTISKLEILGKEEREKILYQFNNTSADFPRDKAINQLFKDTAKKYFNKIAIYCNEKEITYSQLDKMSDQLAVRLIQNGVAQDDIVALLVDRSEYMIVGIIAIIKSGAAYLPLDINLPSQRIDHILEKSKVTVALTNNYYISDKSIKTIDVKNESIYNKETYNLPEISNSQRLLYVIFTSGSTGEPKGVMIEHRGMVNLILSMNKLLRITNDDVFLLLTTISFDISGLEIHAPLLSGGQVVIAGIEEQLDPRLMFELIEDKGVSVLQVTPSRLKEIIKLENSWKVLNKLKSLLVGGEEFPVSLYNKVINSFSGTLFNGYGPTEVTIYSTVKELKANAQVNIGLPIKNIQAYILSESAELLPIGVIGELCLSGDGLARGYFNDEELSKEKFISHPFLSGARLYKTGDLARWTLNGEIEFLGRKDNQVKIRGFRIETGDIEHQLLKFKEIAEAVVIALEDDKEEKFLCAYVVTDDSLFELNVSEIKEKLGEVLPDYMIPSYIEQIEKLPISNSGKINRRALPKPTFKIFDNFEDPVGTTELSLLQIWQNILGLENKAISRNISFFDIGGHSLKVISLVSLIHKVFEVKLDVNDIFRTKTIKEQANLISLSKTNLYYSIKKAEKKDFYELSSHQKRLFVLQKMDVDSVVYNMPGILRLSKKISKKEVSKIFNILILRHESFRTSFNVINESPVQLIHEEVDLKIEEFVIEKEELRNLRNQFIQVFDLSEAPLLRVAIVEVKGDGYLLMIDMHHIISDGVSHLIIEKEFKQLLEGRALDSINIQYKDYSVWQNSDAQKQKVQSQGTFWQKKYKGDIPVLNLPTDYPRPVIQSYVGSTVNFELNKEEAEGIRLLSKEYDITLYMSLLSIYTILLSKLSGQESIVLGTPIAGRNHPDIENTVGMFVNTLALYNNVREDDTIKEFVERLKQTTIEAFDNQDYPFEYLVESVVKERDTSRNAIFDVMFNLLKGEEFDEEITDGSNKKIVYSGISKFDLTLTAIDFGKQLLLEIEYCSKLFKPETINRFIRYFKKIAYELYQNLNGKVSEIDILSLEEKKELLYLFNDTCVSYPKQKSIAQIFIEQVQIYPEKIALEDHNRSYTYLELDLITNKISNYLKTRGVEVESLVGLMAGRSVEMIFGILGILKSGGAYVPIDPTYPKERINHQILDSGITILLATDDIENQYEFKGNIVNLGSEAIIESKTDFKLPFITSSNLAYVMYTSGSTGNPKGVEIEQKSVVRLVKNNNFFPFSSEQKILLTGAPVFDATIFEIWGSLLNGGSLFIASNDVIVNANLLGDCLRRNEITSLWLTSSLFNQLVDENESIFDTLEHLLVGGDILSVKHINKVKSKNKRLLLINGYGPTENTTFSCTYNIEKEYKNNIPIGKPISNSTVYIVSKQNKLQPIGVHGELLVGGDGLARKYLNNSELTREKFIDSPFNQGERLYRTGDLARWLPDGNIEFLGRIDNQVKIRGYRIELGEIENTINDHPEVKECLVLTGEGNGEKYLSAYVVLEQDFKEDLIRGYLLERLPEYMIPLYIIKMDSFPLTQNGKINRKLLPVPEYKVGDDFVMPANELEKKLVKIWSEVLNISTNEISVTTNFFAIGGHSLKAAILSGKINKAIGLEFSIREIFLYSNIRTQANYLKSKDVKGFVSIPKAQEKEYYKLSSAQKRIFLLQQLDLDSTVYNMPYVIKLGFEINAEKVNEVFNQLINRHESFRTSFELKFDEPIQKIHDKVDFNIERYTIEKAEENILKDKFIRAFELSQAPLFRVALVQVIGSERLLMIDMHHIIGDGVSQTILEREFNELLRGNKLEPLHLQYRDYSEWQIRQQQHIKIKEQEKYWLTKFEGEIPVFDLPTDFVRPSIMSHEGAFVRLNLNKEETENIKYLAEKCEVTLYMSILSVFTILLYKLSGQDDIIVGTPVAGRNHNDLEEIVGMFVNTLAIRSNISGNDSIEEFLSRVKQNTLEAFENQDYQFEDLVEKISVKRDTSRNPIFNVMFNLLVQENNFDDLLSDNYQNLTHERSISKFDLNLTAIDYGDDILINWEYCSKLFKAETIERYIGYFKQLINQIPDKIDKSISEIAIIGEAEKQKLLYDFNNTKADYLRDKTIFELFAEQAYRTPGNIAVFTQDKSITYEELYLVSVKLAKLIQSKGVSKGRVVGLMVDRSIEMIVGVMGILGSGCCYLPILPNTLNSRLEYIIKNSECALILTQTKYQEKLTEKVECINLENLESISSTQNELLAHKNPNELAYIIYTSGSTGEPKGVMIENHSVINRIKWMQKRYPIGIGDTILQKTPYTFDVSVWELFWWSFEGASVFMLEPEGEKDPALIARTIGEKKINVMHFVPSMLEAFLNFIEGVLNEYNLESLKYVFASGEALKPNQVHSFYQLFTKNVNTKLINLYGPTEATVDVSYFDCLRDVNYKNIPIGKPIDNIQLYILDKDTLQLQAVGVVGELMISGVGLSRGYIKQEKLTQEKFISHPFIEGDKLYRTGDLARWLPDGTIEFLGRIDHQVKIRGFRIELGEIESAILQYENVKESVVIACEENGDKYLCAYLVKEKEFNQVEMSTYLTANLPDYMIPSYFVELDKIPLTANGKVNRKALPLPEVKAGNDYIAPSTETEESLVEIWSEVLNIAKEAISVSANFFTIGGNSIKSIQISSRLRNLGYKISVQEIFSNPTIKAMANICNNSNDSSQYKLIDEIDLSPIQNRYFTNNEGVNQFNQVKILEFPNSISKDLLEVIFIEIMNHYDSLRIRIENSEKGGRVQRQTDKITRFNIIEKRIAKTEAFNEELKELENELKNRININKDPIQVVLLHADVSSYILIGVHYLLIDEYSWEILLSSISDLYSKSLKNNKLVLSSKYEFSNSWFIDFENYKGSDRFKETKKYWDKYFNKFKDYYASARGVKKDIKSESGFLSITIDEKQTKALHNKTNLHFNTKTGDILLSALLLRFKNELKWDKIAIDLESDGRQELNFEKLICNEVGRFSSIYPQIINIGTSDEDLGDFIKNIKESLNTVPNGGFDYLAYKYLQPSEFLNNEITDTIPLISYKHLTLDKKDRPNHLFKVLNERYYVNTIPEKNQRYLLEIISYYEDDKLKLDLFFDKQEIPKEFINKLEYGIKTELDNLTKYCIALNKQEKTPSDYTYKKLSFVELKKLNDKYDFSDIYPLSPLQEGMYYHYLLNPETLSFLPQLRFRLKGNLKEDILRESLNELLSQYDILRTIFVHKELDQPLQIVLNEKEMPFTFKDIRLECKNSDKASVLNKYKEFDRNKLFDLSKDILIRITVLQIEENEYEFIFTHHHILIDGWCINILTNKFFELYYKNANLNIQSTSTAGQYVNYINWLAGKNKERTKSYWQEYLKGYNNLSILPIEKNESNGSFKYEIIKLDLNQTIVEKCELLAQSYGITTSAIFSGVWGLMLSFYNDISDVVFGFVVSGRSSEISGVENMLGLFMNTIPVRVKFDENKCFKDLLVEIHNNIGKGESHHFYSLADIKNNLNLKRDLFDHYIVYQNVPISEHDYADSKNDSNSLMISNVRNNAHTNYDFGINIIPGKETKIEFKFNSAVYNSDDIKIISNHFNKLFYNAISESSNTISEIKENLESEFSADFKRYRKTEEIEFANKTVVNSNRSSSERESLDSWDELS